MNRRGFLQNMAAAAIGSTIGHGGLNAFVSASRPNILLCLADDVSHPHMGAYGTSWIRTPGFERVAQEGLLFSRTYTPNSKCAPSRACLLTGRNSWQLEEAANHWCYFPTAYRTCAEALCEHGYHVGYTAKGWGPGVPVEIRGRNRQLTGIPFNKRRLQPVTSHLPDYDYAGNFKDFLEAKPEDRPFFFWYGSLEPHRAYEYGSGAAKGGKKTSQIDRVFSFWPDNEEVRHDLLDYAFELEYFDSHLRTMLDLLEEQGRLDNTLVIVTADNGMPFPRAKGQAYERSTHLPLAIMWKEGIRNAGRVIDDFVSFIDFAPTFLEAAGLRPEESGMQPMEGRSLMDLFSSSRSGWVDRSRDSVLVGKERHDVGRPHDWGYPIRGIVKGDYLYLRNFEPDRWPAGNPETGYLNCDGSPTKTACLELRRKGLDNRYWDLCFGKRPEEELYQIRRDPDCCNNLAAQAESAQLKEALRGELLARLTKQNDPRVLGKGHVFDEYPYADPNGRNFYARYMSGEKMRASWVNETDFER
jgi:N-sulfoglucosamine sulfohydrolase